MWNWNKRAEKATDVKCQGKLTVNFSCESVLYCSLKTDVHFLQLFTAVWACLWKMHHSEKGMEWRNVKWCIDHDSIIPPKEMNTTKTPRKKSVLFSHGAQSLVSNNICHHWDHIPFTASKYSTFEKRMNPELLWTTRFFFTEYFITHVLIKSKKASHPHHSPWSRISWELLHVMWASEQRDTILANII